MGKGTLFCIAKGGDGKHTEETGLFRNGIYLAFSSLSEALNGTEAVLLVVSVQVIALGIAIGIA